MDAIFLHAEVLSVVNKAHAQWVSFIATNICARICVLMLLHMVLRLDAIYAVLPSFPILPLDSGAATSKKNEIASHGHPTPPAQHSHPLRASRFATGSRASCWGPVPRASATHLAIEGFIVHASY